MILPPQKLSKADRLKRDDITGKNNIEETIDFYISTCNWSSYTEEIFQLYRAVEGTLNQADYKMVQNPQNKQKVDDAPLQFNAVLKNYNILKGIANVLMGEFGRRSHDMVVTSINPSDELSYKDALNIALKNYHAQAVANVFLDLEFNLGQTRRELPPIEQYVADFKETFDSTRLVSGQEVLDYIKYNCDLDSKYLDLYWDWVVTGGCYTYKTVNHDDVYFEVVPRHELFVPFERHSRFVEDFSYAVRRQVLPAYKIVDFFRGRISEEIIDALEAEINNGLSLKFANIQLTGRNGFMVLPTLYNTDNNFNNLSTADNGIELFHVQYKTWKMYYELDYLDTLGQERTMEVGEDYELNKAQGDLRLRRKWENVLYEGYRVLDYYLDCGEVLENRADLNQAGLQKLAYNGILERSIVGEVQSIIKEGLPYQRLVNVLHFQMEKLINKNKDKIIVMPYGLVPRKKGIDTKTQMYHADATSVLWVDETAPNAALAAQMIKTLDLSLGSYIKDTISLIQYVKQEYWETIGMNAQRYSDISQSAGKAVTEQAIQRSAIITYELTRQFDKLIEKDYQGLLDISKLAYINGKKAKYIRSDASQGFLQLNADGAAYHSETSYNVFVRDSAEMTEAIQAIRGQALSLIQNGASMSVLGRLWETNSVAKLTNILEKLEANKREYEQLMQKQKDDAAMALADKQAQTEQLVTEREKYKADMAYQGVVDSATIRTSDTSSRDLARPDSPVEQQLAAHKINKENKELAIKDKMANQSKIQTKN